MTIILSTLMLTLQECKTNQKVCIMFSFNVFHAQVVTPPIIIANVMLAGSDCTQCHPSRNTDGHNIIHGAGIG